MKRYLSLFTIYIFAEAHNNLGYSLRKQGPQNYSKALAHYNKAISVIPALMPVVGDNIRD